MTLRRHDPGRAVWLALALGLGAAALLIPPRSMSAPTWWTTRGVVTTNASPADYAPATLGQLKNFAAKAYDEFQTNLQTGAGATLSNLVFGFSNTNNFAPVTLGQLKNVTKPFYDRLIAAGYTNTYPWTTNTTDDADFAPANIGQLKRAFDFTPDGDGDGMPDWWEMMVFGNATNSAAGDFDGDGLSNIFEYQAPTDPTNSDTNQPLVQIVHPVSGAYEVWIP